MSWTEAQIQALVGEAGTLKRGQELAVAAKWSQLGQTPAAVWGECAGSGARPYQTGVFLAVPAFTCTCPSRVFPCKHGVGLLLLFARQPELPHPAPPPDWLTPWLIKQQSKLPVPGPVAVFEAPGEAEAARRKREHQRLERMGRGAEELELWLLDSVRNGLASLDKQPPAFWEQQAARLVDAQLPGLAATVRGLGGLRHSAGPAWPATMLARLGELYVLLRTFQNLPRLPESARQEVLQRLGVTIRKEELLAQQPAVADTWQVMGELSWEEERLTARRTWLWGRQTRRYALLLEYAFGGQPFATVLVPGGSYHGTLVFYPGLQPLRAVPGELVYDGHPAPGAAPPEVAPAQLLEHYADALGQNPWEREWPVRLAHLVPVLLADDTWVLQHVATGQQLPLLGSAAEGWPMLAVGGGHPMCFFGEWNGQAFRALTYAPSLPSPATHA